MKNIFLTIVLLQIVHTFCSAQSFTYHSDAPFGIVPIKPDTTRSAAKIMFYDFDLDGDFDLFMSGLDFVEGELLGWEDIHFFFEMQENVGDRFHPVFAERQDAFDQFPFPVGLFFPTLGDVNGDDKVDVIMNGDIDFMGNVTMLYALNTGTLQNPDFEVTRADTMDLDLFVPESFFDPALVDLDSDGDLDILMSGFDPAFAEEDGPDIPRFYYAKNFGTPINPNFRGWYSDPYGLIPDTLSEITTVGDIDNDGDMDIVGTGMKVPADSIHTIKVHLNTPTPQGNPGFHNILQSPYGLPVSHGEEQFLFPNLVDLDGDGDLDLFVFKLTSDGTLLQYYENSLCTATTDEVFTTICEGDILDFEGQQFTQEGTYAIHTVGEDGCTKVITLHLAVEDIAVVDLEATICAGETYSVGGQEFSAEGQYEISLVTSNGCDSLVILLLHVSTIDDEVLLFEETLTANQFGVSYQWIDCSTGGNIAGATEQSYTPLVSGNYAVILTDANNCMETSECINVIITGTSEALYKGLLEISPNPADDLVSVRNETGRKISGIELIAVSGKSALQERQDVSQQLDISSLPSGVYVARILVEEHIVIRRLIIQ